MILSGLFKPLSGRNACRSFSTIQLKPERSIPRLKVKSLKEFKENLQSYRQPVVYQNAASNWPALSKWQDPNYWKKFKAMVPVDIGLYTIRIFPYHQLEPTFTFQFLQVPWGFMTWLGQAHYWRSMYLLSNILQGTFTSYLVYKLTIYILPFSQNPKKAQISHYPLLKQIPELEDDIEVPSFLNIPTKTIEYVSSGWYKNETHFLIWIKKYIDIDWEWRCCYITTTRYSWTGNGSGCRGKVLSSVPPCTRCLHLSTWRTSQKYKQREYRSTQLRYTPIVSKSWLYGIYTNYLLYSLTLTIGWKEAIIKPGEALYIPKGFWYYTKDLEYSCSVGFSLIDKTKESTET